MKNIQVTIDIDPIGPLVVKEYVNRPNRPLAVKADVNRPNRPAGSIKEKIGKERYAVCSHRDVDDLLK